MEHDDCVDDLDPPKTPAKPHAKMPLAESSEEEAQARQASLEEPKEQENDAQKDGQSGRFPTITRPRPWCRTSMHDCI